ncbi:h-type lectin domain-containing protein [Fusarium globosum]|uniref:H-type lectin domain-containing protein n=1 Tax=Fusarium globosum TaxID=78864 RepID=A0A8H5YZS9_9HYPO|nr:h-type lectin domain-containing protein [Fusarium globosum]
MTTVNSLVKLCKAEGLSFDTIKYHQDVTGFGSVFEALEKRTNIKEIEVLLWGNPKNVQEMGLLSSLEAIAKETNESVTAAWKACGDSAKAIQMLEDICVQATSPLPDVQVPAVNIPAALKEVWDVVARGHRSMERARHGHDASTDCFLSFLFNRRDTRLDKFMADLGVVESIYDKSSRERFLLENFYEAVRIENIPGLKIWVGAQFAETGPLQIKKYRGSMRFGVPFADGDDADVERPYRIARHMVLYVSNDQVVPTEETRMALQELRRDRFDFVDIHLLEVALRRSMFLPYDDFPPVCLAIYQMQGILNTLSGPDGPWTKDSNNAKARAMISVREELARSIDYIEEIEESVEMLNRNVLDLMLKRFSDLMSTLQDLSANLLYGDDDDQHINLTELMNSTKLWTSSFSCAKSFIKKAAPIHFRDRVGYAEISDYRLQEQVERNGADWTQVVMGFEKVDLDRRKPLYSLIAHQDAQKDAPTITTYGDPNSIPVGARARMLQLPKSSQSEFGRVSNWQQAKTGDYYEIPVTFANTYNSKPNVTCWLEGFEAHTTKNLRVCAEVIDTTDKGCVIRIGGWWDTELVHVNAVWFAHAADHPHVFTGGGSVHKYGQHSDIWAPFVSFDFPEGKFKKRRPDIFLAISLLDTHHLFNPRCELKATNVTKRGMKVSVDAWWDTYCYKAGFSCIAFDPDFFQDSSKV